MDSPNLIDICFNLTHESFREDEREVMDRAQQAGIEAMICPGSSLRDSRQAQNLAKAYARRIYATAGVHPHHASEWTSDSRQELAEMVDDIVAIGECGLDYNRNYSPRAAQLTCFEEQLDVAVASDLPVLLHERDAHEDFHSLLQAHRDRLPGAVAHCFTGERDALFAYLDLDLYVGITGWICDERRGRHLLDLVKHIPLDRLLIETDAPYLLPRSLPKKPRGRRNEPAYLPHVLDTIARARGESAMLLAEATTANAKRLFGLN